MNVRLDRVLPKRMAVSIKEGLKHWAAFEAFNGGLEALRPEEVAEWRASVIKWEAKQHKDSKDSPFEVAVEAAGEWTWIMVTRDAN